MSEEKIHIEKNLLQTEAAQHFLQSIAKSETEKEADSNLLLGIHLAIYINPEGELTVRTVDLLPPVDLDMALQLAGDVKTLVIESLDRWLKTQYDSKLPPEANRHAPTPSCN